MTEPVVVRAIRRWKSVPSNLRPSPEDFRPLPGWRWVGDDDISDDAVEKMGATWKVGHLSSEEVRQVAAYVYRFVASTVALHYAAALRTAVPFKLKLYREAMAPLVEAARNAADRPTAERLAAVLDYCRREGVNPF